MPAANDIRRGQVIKFNGEPHLVMETQHRTPGNLRAFVQIKMRNLRYGKALDQRFASTDTIEVMPTEKRSSSSAMRIVTRSRSWIPTPSTRSN